MSSTVAARTHASRLLVGENGGKFSYGFHPTDVIMKFDLISVEILEMPGQ